MQDRFEYLNIGLGLILAFVGLKMLGGYFFEWHPPTWTSLAVIVVILTITILASLRTTNRRESDSETTAEEPSR